MATLTGRAVAAHKETGNAGVALTLAGFVICEALGFEWYTKNIGAGARGYFERGIADNPADPQNWHGWRRVILLGEMLYALGNVPGMSGRLKGLMTEDLESVIGELEAAKLLFSKGIRFEFVTPEGTHLGANYDIVVPSKVGPAPNTNCEIKTKEFTTECSKGTVLRSLKCAREQLPENAPGVVILKAPESWLWVSGALSVGAPLSPEAAVMASAVDEFLRNTKHVAAVVVFGLVIYANQGGEIYATGLVVERNYKSQHHWQAGLDLLDKLEERGMASAWPRFVDLAADFHLRLPKA